MTGQRSNIQEEVRFRLLRLLENNPEMSQREIAVAVGIRVGRAHYALKALIEKGLFKLGNFSAAADKRRYAYILMPRVIVEKVALTKHFLLRKRAEFDALNVEIKALQDEVETDVTPPGVQRGGK